MKRTIIILAVAAAAPVLQARMSLNDCLVYAREHAHTNIINRCEAGKAAVDKRLAASELMPYVTLSTSGNMSFGRNIDPETNTYDNKKTLATGFGLQMSLPLFDGLVSINNLKSARVAHRRRQQAAKAEEDRVSLAVIRAFYNVSYCKAMVMQMEQQLERDSTDLRATERCEELGTKSGADMAEMRAIVAADEYELANQRNLLAKAYLTLRSEMGMELDDAPLDLVENEDEGPAGHSDVNPRIAEAELALRQSKYELRAARGAFSPKISMNAGLSTSYYKMLGSEVAAPSFSSQWHNNMGHYVGFTVTLPLFTGLANINRVKRAKIEVMENETRLEQTRYEIEKETAEAALDLRAATAEHTAAIKRLAAAELAFKAVRRKFELGSASAIDLHTSSASLAAARASLEGKRIQKIISAIVLAYYHGEELIRK